MLSQNQVKPSGVGLVGDDVAEAYIDRAPASTSCLLSRLIVEQRALLDDEVALLPAVYVVGPLGQDSLQLGHAEKVWGAGGGG